MELFPVKFKPVFKSRLWGSNLFNNIFNLDIVEPVGECLQFIDCDDAQSIVDGGKFNGKPLRWLLEEYGEGFGFTSQHCEDSFGLLCKYLDVNDVLSVQVSPDSNVCEKYSLPGSRVVCWYVIEAKHDAYIYLGLKDGVLRADMEEAVRSNTVAELLNKRPVKKGDFFYVPAGTIHAPGAGLLIAEISTSSTTTFRLHDWGRVDSKGKKRELHIARALDSTYFEDTVMADDIQSSFMNQNPLESIAEMLGDSRVLVNCPYFNVYKVESGSGKKKFKTAIPLMIIPVSGRVVFYNDERPDEKVELSLGIAGMVPEMQHGVVEYSCDSVLLVCCPGPVKMGLND